MGKEATSVGAAGWYDLPWVYKTPPGWPGHDIQPGFILGLILGDKADLSKMESDPELQYLLVQNKERLAEDARNSSTSLPAAGSTLDLEKTSTDLFKDFLNPKTEDILYLLLVGFGASHFAEFVVKVPASQSRGGNKSTPEGRFTSKQAPLNPLSLPINVWGDTYPRFHVVGMSQETLTWAQVRAAGYKLRVTKLARRPGDKPVTYVPVAGVIDQ